MGRVSGGDACNALGLRWAGRLAARPLSVHARGGGSVGRLGQLHGGVVFRPTSQAKKRKSFLISKPFIVSQIYLNSKQIRTTPTNKIKYKSTHQTKIKYATV
jgi:hypothetical protein